MPRVTDHRTKEKCPKQNFGHFEDPGSGPIKQCLEELRHGDGGVAHTVGEAPLVIIPGQDANEVAVHDLGLGRIKGRAVRVVVEVNRNQRCFANAKNAFERAVWRLL